MAWQLVSTADEYGSMSAFKGDVCYGCTIKMGLAGLKRF